MKKFLRAMLVVLALVIGAVAMVGCGGEKDIMVIGRQEGSGTRDAFESIVAKGDEKLEDAQLVSTFEGYESTGVVLSKVAENKTAIGYVSLGAVDDTVKVLNVNGVTPSSATVLDKSYVLQRPFVILTKKNITLTAATQDFITYLQSNQAQEIVLEEGYVQQITATTTDYVVPSDLTEIEAGVVNLRGSTSVEEVMELLIKDYLERTGLPTSHINMDCEGSGAGKDDVKGDTNGNIIGMSSSSLTLADDEYASYFNIALDAVAVIVNNSNELEDITIEQIFDIYTGAITKFSTLLPAEEEAA